MLIIKDATIIVNNFESSISGKVNANMPNDSKVRYPALMVIPLIIENVKYIKAKFNRMLNIPKVSRFIGNEIIFKIGLIK